MAIKLEDIEIFSNSLGNNFGGGGTFGGASSGGGTNLTGIPNADYLQNLANLLQQQQGPQLGPDDFGSYSIPASDPTYRTGFDYARSIAGGIPMSQVIAPGVSYSPEQPMGYTQEQLNIPKDVVTPPPEPPKPDDPSFLGTGIGGVNIPVDRKQIPPRNIFGGLTDTRGQRERGEPLQGYVPGGGGINYGGPGFFDNLLSLTKNLPVDRKQDFPPLSNLLNIDKLFGGGFDKDAIEKIVQERIAESKKIQETKPDMPTFIPEVPTGRDFSIDREILERPMISGLENRDFMDADSLITGVPTGREFSIDRDRQPIYKERQLPPPQDFGYGPGIMPPLPPMDIINLPPVDLPPIRSIGKSNLNRFSIEQLPMGLFV